MNEHLAFAQCLQRVLNETEMTATEVARRLEMRSRNSIFRILKGKTSPQLNRRFLESFHKHMGEQLTEAQWAALNRALEMDAVGAVEYKSRQALMQLVGAFSEPISPAKVCYLDAWYRKGGQLPALSASAVLRRAQGERTAFRLL